MSEMFDSTNVGSIPGGATELLVYTDGLYANEAAARARFPNAILHTISATGEVVAEFIDCEAQDVWPPDAAVDLYLGWRNKGCKGFYCSTSVRPQISAALQSVGINPYSVQWIEADPTGVPHVLNGDVATQWGWFAGYDESETTPQLDPPPPVPPAPPLPKEEPMYLVIATAPFNPPAPFAPIVTNDQWILAGGKLFGVATAADSAAAAAACPVLHWTGQQIAVFMG